MNVLLRINYVMFIVVSCLAGNICCVVSAELIILFLQLLLKSTVTTSRYLLLTRGTS
jgi:hypothetical protein